MSDITEWVSAAANLVSAIATTVAAVGVWYAHRQLHTSQRIAQMQFEDSLAKEYRELANRLPTKALLGEELSKREYKNSFDELFHYVDLSNEQVSLRRRGRVSTDVWQNWAEGIAWNLSLPAFATAWSEVKSKDCSSFHDLRMLEEDNFKGDPRYWPNHRKLATGKS